MPVSCSVMEIRTGIGFDVHRLVRGRHLILGGITIPFPKGLLGHSDGDVLTHAVCDALLGAMGEGDIGTHFPDTDKTWKGENSLRFLKVIRRKIQTKKFSVINIDACVLAERPRLSPYRIEMGRNIAVALRIKERCVNVKATTTEGLGFIGAGKGLAAMAVATLKKKA